MLPTASTLHEMFTDPGVMFPFVETSTPEGETLAEPNVMFPPAVIAVARQVYGLICGVMATCSFCTDVPHVPVPVSRIGSALNRIIAPLGLSASSDIVPLPTETLLSQLPLERFVRQLLSWAMYRRPTSTAACA